MWLTVVPGAPVEDLASALIDIPSVSGDERAITDQIEAVLRGVPHLEVLRLGNALVARTSLGRAERVIIAGHVDTVPIKDNVPSTRSEDEEWIVGRGSVDMKCGIAVQLALAVELSAPTRDVTWVFYDQEEVEEPRNGLGRIARERPELLEGDFAILGEPTSAVIEGGCNGTLRLDVTVHGKAAHSARAWKGINAIQGAAPILAALAVHAPEDVEVDGLTYREGVNAVGITGGIAGNVIPDICTVTINYRFSPAWTIDEAKARVERLLTAAFEASQAPEGQSVTWKYTDEAAAARPGLDAPIAIAFADAVAATGAAAPRAKLGWTDVARFGQLGIPAVNYGPGDPERAHADDERCPIDDVRRCHAALRDWLSAPIS